MKIFGPWRRRAIQRQTAERLYRSVVVQARLPVFYESMGVPDTADGRFDMVALHSALLLRRLHRDHTRSRPLAQAVFDLMFADMDQNLREMGVGDLGVGHRVKAMARGFYGRLDAYDRGLDQAGDDLAEALRRNVYRKNDPAESDVAALVDYVRKTAEALDTSDLDAISEGNDIFPIAPTGAGPAEGKSR